MVLPELAALGKQVAMPPDDTESDWIYAADAAEAWSSALVGVLEDPDYARRLGTAARQRIEAEFALPAVVDRYVELYRKLLDGTWPPTRMDR